MRAFALVDDADYERVAERRWSLTAAGYVVCRGVYLHREIMGLEFGDGREVDHRNFDRLDCRRENLRIVAPKHNRRNLRSRRGSTSRYRGVYWIKRRQCWGAAVTVDGRAVWQGYFASEIEAARAAEAVRLAQMPGALPDPTLAEAA